MVLVKGGDDFRSVLSSEDVLLIRFYSVLRSSKQALRGFSKAVLLRVGYTGGVIDA